MLATFELPEITIPAMPIDRAITKQPQPGAIDMCVRLGFRISAALLLALCSFDARANILINGDFESQPNFGSGLSNDPGFSELTGAQIPGWKIASGHSTTIHNTVLYPTISGKFSANLDGEGRGGVNADLSQDFNSIAGAGYTLDFDYAGWYNAGGVFKVTVFDSTPSNLVYDSGNLFFAALTHISAPFSGTGNLLTLRIEQTGPGSNDNTIIVDNFSITPNAVPEPATWMVWGGLCAVGAVIAYYRRSVANAC